MKADPPFVVGLLAEIVPEVIVPDKVIASTPPITQVEH